MARVFGQLSFKPLECNRDFSPALLVFLCDPSYNRQRRSVGLPAPEGDYL